MASTLEGVVTLPGIASSGVAVRTDALATGSTTLLMLTVTGAIGTPASTAVITVTLPALSASGSGGEANRLRGAIRLPALKASAGVRNRARIYNLTGRIRANGAAIFCFIGPPERAIEWSIAVGAGALFPLSDEFTDAWGRATCRYEAGGFTGALTIRVSYGA